MADNEIAQYRRDGYVVVTSLLRDSDFSRIDRAITDLVAPALSSGKHDGILDFEPESSNGRQVVQRVLSPFGQHETFRGLANDSRILDRIESLIGPSIQLHHSKLNMKGARVGSAVEWHQDLTYFPHTNTDLVATLIYLDDASEENGCLQVVPRCHNRYLDCHTSDGAFAGMVTEDITCYGKPVALAAPAGSVIFMHCLTPHSSLPNRSSRSRRTLIYEYRAGDSYPIYYGRQAAYPEGEKRQLRGEPELYARFSGPPPLMPRIVADFKSIFELQTESKKRMRA